MIVSDNPSSSKSMLITGASSGIGRELARTLASRGWNLAIAARRSGELQDLAGELRSAHNVNVEAITADLSTSVAAQSLLSEAEARCGEIDTVLANAGGFAGGRIGSGGFSASEKMLNVNVVGTFALIDAAVQMFLDRGSGHVVAISSVAGWKGHRYSGAYSASKAAVDKYMQSLRAELKGSGVHATTVFPGYIDTPINAAMKSRPFLISAPEGARRIADAIDKKQATKTVPFWPWALSAPFLKLAS